ncbi:MAG: DUF2219 family protein [Pseudorhodobacter sp.]|nr:DUF2219 family protein [Pseudorhodobacter sp.]
MFKAFLALAFCGLFVTSPVLAQDRVTLGHARLFSNDALGDGHDRWRSGSYSVSRLRGFAWDGALPASPGEILEFRLRSEIIAPADLIAPAPGDRRYAGVLAVGMHTHFALGQTEASLGADLVVTGPQTGIGDFQRGIHDLLGLTEPQVLGNQIANGFHPTARAEIGRTFHFGGALSVRPFAEAQAGVETLLRLGGDMVIGGFGTGALMVRDTVTGQRVEGIAGSDGKGFSVTVGGDVARVFDSAYLPAGGAAQLSETRRRLRAGLNWQGDKTEVFYGVTLLGREFDAQPGDQLVGSLRLRLRF